MTQAERRLFLIRSLMKEKTEYRDLSIPAESGEQKRLRCGAIVNAANSGMTGCYIPCHACIDNCHPHLCGRPAAAGMCPLDGGAGAR